jgi:transposase-like protein
MQHWTPHSITTDKLGSYPKSIHRLQREGKLSKDTRHRTSKYLNNIIEASIRTKALSRQNSSFAAMGNARRHGSGDQA